MIYKLEKDSSKSLPSTQIAYHRWWPPLVENQHFVSYFTSNLVLLIMCPHTYVSIKCYVLHIFITHIYYTYLYYTYLYVYMSIYMCICKDMFYKDSNVRLPPFMWHDPFLKDLKEYHKATFIDVKSVLKPEKQRFFKKQSRFLTTYK